MNDTVNGLFELFGAILVLLHIKNLLRDKLVRGLSIWPHIFFSSWGWWNIYYYPSLGQWLSTYGGVCLAVTNSTYLVMLIYYRYRETWRADI